MKLSNKIALFSLFVMLFASTKLMAQPIVMLSDNKSDYTQTTTGYVLNFELHATSAELAEIEGLVAGNENVSMQVELIMEGKYNIVYTVDHQNHPEYVHKMMFATGFDKINHNGQDYDLNKIIEILYSYQD